MLSLVRVRLVFVKALIVCGWVAVAMGQTTVNRVVGPDRIVGPIDEARVVTLLGNVHPLARGEFDVGVISAETPLDRMVLELEPSAAQQAELDSLLEAQHDAASPLYHQWLTPAEYGARFGASALDLARITTWLAGHGFAVEEIAASGRQVVFSGTAGMVADTFHTEIHRYVVNGAEHMGNAQDPQIPAALAGVVGGVVSLHDFRRTSEIKTRIALAAQAVVGGRTVIEAQPQYTSGSTHYLFPADWATIYDLNPLYSAGTKGTGTSIAIVGRSNINVSDVTAFRSASGLTANNPTVILVGANPGLVSGDQDESTLDVEWSGAVAPAAAVKFVVGDSTATTDGVDLSAQYVVNHETAPVVSTSYGSCEQDMGTAELAFYNGLWEQAASQGMSAFVSSGDSGASGCDLGSASTGTGRGVNGLCTSPYSTCVGGTEFNDGSNAANYWAATNTASYGSALSYIPEEVWNESGSNGGAGLWASGGGASVVYPEPSWQKGVSGTSAANGMRAVPDVAMAAAAHDGYILYENGSYWVVSGTSAASPTFAGVMALVVEAKGGTGQGNANAGLYPLVDSTHNPFHATPSGSNSVPGVTGFTASGAAYNQATGGWGFAGERVGRRREHESGFCADSIGDGRNGAGGQDGNVHGERDGSRERQECSCSGDEDADRRDGEHQSGIDRAGGDGNGDNHGRRDGCGWVADDYADGDRRFRNAERDLCADGDAGADTCFDGGVEFSSGCAGRFGHGEFDGGDGRVVQREHHFLSERAAFGGDGGVVSEPDCHCFQREHEQGDADVDGGRWGNGGKHKHCCDGGGGWTCRESELEFAGAAGSGGYADGFAGIGSGAVAVDGNGDGDGNAGGWTCSGSKRRLERVCGARGGTWRVVGQCFRGWIGGGKHGRREHQRGLRSAEGFYGGIWFAHCDAGRVDCLDADADGKFERGCRVVDAEPDGEGDRREYGCGLHREPESADDDHADASNADGRDGFDGCFRGAGADGNRCDFGDGQRDVCRGGEPERERTAERGDCGVEHQSCDAERGEWFFHAEADGFIRGKGGDGDDHSDGQRGRVDGEQADHSTSGAGAGGAVDAGGSYAFDGAFERRRNYGDGDSAGRFERGHGTDGQRSAERSGGGVQQDEFCGARERERDADVYGEHGGEGWNHGSDGYGKRNKQRYLVFSVAGDEPGVEVRWRS